MVRTSNAERAAWDDTPEPLYWVAVRVLDLLVRVLFRLSIVGGEHLPRQGGAVLAPNHISALDPVVLAVAAHRLGRKVRFFALEILFRRPVLGWVLRESRQIPVYRGLGTVRATERISGALDAGELVVIYPEGTIARPGRRPPARRGVGRVVAECNVSVIPIAMWGMERRHGGYRLAIRRRAAVLFGAPMDLTPFQGHDDEQSYQEAADLILGRIRALEPAARRFTAPDVKG